MRPPVEPDALPPVVAVAASAGGIPALCRLLGALPASFPAAVLVVQHVKAGRTSLLSTVLGLHTALPVAEARGGERPRAGQVYVAPPGHHMVLEPAGRLALSDAPPEHFVRPSAEPLFASVARCCGARAIAVVLTGRLDDGSRGVVLVKRMGGTVIVQDPATSLEFGMPAASIASGAADYVVALDDIAHLLVELLSHEPTTAG